VEKTKHGVIDYGHTEEFNGPFWVAYLEDIEKKLSFVFKESLEDFNPDTNPKIIAAIMAKILLTSPLGDNEGLQTIADAWVTLNRESFEEPKITIHLENDDETWEIVGKDLTQEEENDNKG